MTEATETPFIGNPLDEAEQAAFMALWHKATGTTIEEPPGVIFRVNGHVAWLERIRSTASGALFGPGKPQYSGIGPNF